MFKVGKYYKVWMWEDDDGDGVIAEYPPAQIVEVDLPLVKFRDSAFGDGEDAIVNTASLAFIRAHEVEVED